MRQTDAADERRPAVVAGNRSRRPSHVSMATTHAPPMPDAATSTSTTRSRALRTLNNIYPSPHVIQPHPDNSPNLSGKRKTAVELLEESKALYVKTERVLDRKQEQPHFAHADRAPLLQHHPHRSPMLSLPSAKIRDHYAVFAHPATGDDGAAVNGGSQRVRHQRDGYFTTPPVEKRRLSIRKDNPIPLNVTAVKRFLSRPVSGVDESVQVRKVVPSKSASRLIGFFEGKGSSTGSSSVSPTKPARTRITFSEVLPCICQNNNNSNNGSSRPPELPHRTDRNRPSPPPPIPPKSPALKLRLMREEQQQARRIDPPSQIAQHSKSAATKEAPVFRRIQSEEAPVSLTLVPVAPEVHSPHARTLVRNPVLHKSLPDLNSPKNVRRRAAAARRKIRSASTDLDSCSDTSSRMSRSSSVNIETTSSSDESSNESEAPYCGRPGARNSFTASRSERATTSDYASRSPSFKYETSSLVQTSQNWSLPPWQDDSGAEPADMPPSVMDPQPPPPPPPPPRAVQPDPAARRKAILRSKSDVGPSRFAPDLLPAVPPEFTGDVPQDLDRFFDTIGNQDAAILYHDALNSRCSSPVYFPSVSSVDSCCRRRNADNAYESSDSDDIAASLQRRLLGSQPGMGEPSIVERNARIIKWLIKCRSVPASGIPPSGSAGHLAKLASPHQQQHPLPRSNTHILKQSPVSYYGQSTRL